MTAYDIIKRPIITEQSMADTEMKRYTSRWPSPPTRSRSPKAVEQIFGVKVVRVNTLTVKPKTKRVRYVAGKTRSWKKAIVTLAEGDTIEVFGNQA